MIVIPRPTEDDHPAYVNYMLQNFDEPDAMWALERQPGHLKALLLSVPEAVEHRRYNPGKWSLREVLGHLLDQERVFADRLLRFSRGDAGPLPGFDHEAYVANGGYGRRSVRDLLSEFDLVRSANLCLIRNLDPATLKRGGTVAGHHFSVGALAYLMAAHVEHHLVIIRERYLIS